MAENQATIVGESILISGSLQGDEDLTVLGRVHGNITLTKTLVVEESGRVKADVDVRNAIISGIIVGNITASDSVEVTEQGRVVGDIKAPRVLITDGARFRGNIDMGDLEAERPSAPLPARTVDKGLTKGRTPSATSTALTKPSAPAKASTVLRNKSGASWATRLKSSTWPFRSPSSPRTSPRPMQAVRWRGSRNSARS